MAEVRALREWPQVTIRIETSGRLDLGNVARLFERLNTGIHRAYPGTTPRIEIVALETGSIELKVAVLAAALSAAQLTVQIAEHLQNDPAASRACNDVFIDNGNGIVIVGGKQTARVTPDDIEDNLDYGVAAREVAGPRAKPPPTPTTIRVEGVFEGTVERISGEYFVQLTDRPGLYLRIEDQGEVFEPWEEHQRYRLEGRAHFAPPGRPSAFIVERAMRL